MGLIIRGKLGVQPESLCFVYQQDCQDLRVARRSAKMRSLKLESAVPEKGAITQA